MKFRGKIQIVFIFLLIFSLSGICTAENGGKEEQMSSDRNLFEGFVYYADKQRTGLKSINRRFTPTLDSNELGREIIKALMAGPSLPSLEATWPKDTKINSFFIADDGDAYVDLDLEQGMIEHMDTGSELLAIYSLVNSLTVNIPKIKRVKLLVQGMDAMTLAGHIDLDYFYKTNMLIVK
jgi:hypothetical protein